MALSTRIAYTFPSQASNVEKHARDKGEKYATELKAVERRKDLTVRSQQIGEEEKKVCAQLPSCYNKTSKLSRIL